MSRSRITFLNAQNSNQVLTETINEPINADHKAPRKLRNQIKYDIPVFISTNVRKLDNKLDEIREVSIQNNAKVICITETWLTAQQD